MKAKAVFTTATVSAALALVACGRRATEADCERLVDRIVELQMKELNKDDPTSVKEQKQRVRGTFDAQLKDCVGRRVTDDMMKCVDAAQSTDEVLKCVK